MAKKKDAQGRTEPPSEDVIRSHASFIRTAIKDMASERGEMAGAMERAKDAGINKKAMKLCLSLENMEADARDDFLRSFDNYRAVLGIEIQPDLLDPITEKPMPITHATPQ